MNGLTVFIASIIIGLGIAKLICDKYSLFKSELNKLWEQKQWNKEF